MYAGCSDGTLLRYALQADGPEGVGDFFNVYDTIAHNLNLLLEFLDLSPIMTTNLT